MGAPVDTAPHPAAVVGAAMMPLPAVGAGMMPPPVVMEPPPADTGAGAAAAPLSMSTGPQQLVEED